MFKFGKVTSAVWCARACIKISLYKSKKITLLYFSEFLAKKQERISNLGMLFWGV